MKPAPPSTPGDRYVSESAQTAPRSSRLRSLVLGLCAVGAVGGAVLTHPPQVLTQMKAYPSERHAVQNVQGDRMAAMVAQRYKTWSNPQAQARVDSIGQRLAATSTRTDLPYSFTLVDDSAVNAFSIPGGRLYVTRGLLETMKDDGQLTYVLAHEMGHSEKNHSDTKLMQGLAQTLTTLPLRFGLFGPNRAMLDVGLKSIDNRFGQAVELEADRMAVEHMARIGMGRQPALDALASMPDAAARWSPFAQNALLDHPSNQVRMEAIRNLP